MSRKSEAKKAALAAAKKAAVLPMLLGLSVVLECAWTEQGKGEYPALGLDPKQQKRINDKWKQIVRWRDAVCEQDESIRTNIRRNILHRDMQDKFNRLEQCITRFSKNGRVSYNVALVVETIVISALLVDFFEEHGRLSTNEFYWFICALNTFASWTCGPSDPAVLLANIVYYETRDLFLEKPDWSTMYINAPLSETERWIQDNPDTEFSRAAQDIIKQVRIRC